MMVSVSSRTSVDPDPAMLKTLRWGAADDRLTGIDNGRGATTSISYRAQPGSRSYLPAGLLPIVVDAVTITDHAYTPALVSSTSFDYDHAQWSTWRRAMIGYGTIIAHHGSDTVMETGRELTDICGPRISLHAVKASGGGVISKTTSTFKDPGEAPPYTCRADTVTEFECEQTDQCRSKQTAYTYDAYGNPEIIDETGGGLRRRTYAPVRPNPTDYIVNRPYKQETLTPDPASPPEAPTWIPVTRTLFGYDDDSWEHPPKKRGDLTRVTAYSDITADKASETFYEYDTTGNLRLTTDPVGVKTKVIYDPGRRLFPEKVCTPVGCTTTIWDEVFGVPKKITDPNEAVTTYDYDEYGRLISTTKADRFSNTGSSTTSIDYLDTGVVTGPADSRQLTTHQNHRRQP